MRLKIANRGATQCRSTGCTIPFFAMGSVAVCIILLSLHFIPVAEGRGETRITEHAVNDSYWSYMDETDSYEMIIAGADKGDEYEFSIFEHDDLLLDFYILESGEYDRFKEVKNFSAAFERENISSFPKTKWTCPDDLNYYIIVDNYDDPNRDDAYANATINFTVTWKNVTEWKHLRDYYDNDPTWVYYLLVLLICGPLTCGLLYGINTFALKRR